MWNRLPAAFQRLLPADRPLGGGDGTGQEAPGESGDFRASRKRGRGSALGDVEQEERRWKRFKMGDLMDTVRNTAEWVRLKTTSVITWVRSQSPYLRSMLPTSPAPRRAPVRHRRAAPTVATPPIATRGQIPRNLLEDSSFVHPALLPHATRIPTGESSLAGGDQPAAEKRSLHSPRSLRRPNGQPSSGSTPRSRSGTNVLTPSWKLPRTLDASPSPGAPKQRETEQFRSMYSKTFGVGPGSPHCDSGGTGPGRQARRRFVSTVEQTILHVEKEIYRQLLEAVTADYRNRSSLSRVYSPLSHRDLSGMSECSQRLFPLSEPCSSPPLSPETPPDSSPGPPEGLLALDTTPTGSDSESVIVVKVKKAPRADPTRMPSFDAVHWIKELTSMYDSRARERRRLIEEQEALAQRLKQQRLQDKDSLSKHVTAQLHLAVPLIEEIPIADILQEEPEEVKPRIQVDKEEEFPELTEEMEGEVRRVFLPGNPDEVLTEAFRLTITRKDIHTLNHLNWLNDEVINFYMNLLVTRSAKAGLPTVHAFNTFFFPKVRSDGYQAVRRWTKKVDIFAMDILLVPVHLGVHWCLAVVDFRKKAVSYYDSMGGSNDAACRILLRYLTHESLDKKCKEFEVGGWVLASRGSREIPQQMNGSDCGMFTCKYADYITRDLPITFSQKHMAYFRKKMAWEILHRKLL